MIVRNHTENQIVVMHVPELQEVIVGIVQITVHSLRRRMSLGKGCGCWFRVMELVADARVCCRDEAAWARDD